MENPRPEKVAVVNEVRERLDGAQAAILTEYRGLTVREMAALRQALVAAGGDYKVYKNTLVKLAIAGGRHESLEALLEGPTAIAFVSGEVSAVAKALRDYARTNPALVVKGGLHGEGFLSAQDLGVLADLPASRRPAGPAGRCHRRPHAAAGRSVAGASPEPRLRPVGSPRPEGWGPGGGRGAGSEAPHRGTRRRRGAAVEAPAEAPLPPRLGRRGTGSGTGSRHRCRRGPAAEAPRRSGGPTGRGQHRGRGAAGHRTARGGVEKATGKARERPQRGDPERRPRAKNRRNQEKSRNHKEHNDNG